uniref:Uncharacterized protein n=1 Tax=Chromera velia CCMP2878 TaxID=1169474 RepID=A0A0G4IE29_9ALVE|eukprot:Cvel_13462.t1-p1 / transcript=Cvel_13462.t1 / gene=Cvel_13462 / organism=Chromera_velia_CCMP2878 / gene_product=hypothetical protein / transcript_product=hypothetical protein / location=Cvel_scaffold920:52268-59323(-) / protein_length=1075 / sequence_SO=supercontig / SO=protein_coding / is_pseudo=false
MTANDPRPPSASAPPSQQQQKQHTALQKRVMWYFDDSTVQKHPAAPFIAVLVDRKTSFFTAHGLTPLQVFDDAPAEIFSGTWHRQSITFTASNWHDVRIYALENFVESSVYQFSHQLRFVRRQILRIPGSPCVAWLGDSLLLMPFCAQRVMRGMWQHQHDKEKERTGKGGGGETSKAAAREQKAEDEDEQEGRYFSRSGAKFSGASAYYTSSSAFSPSGAGSSRQPQLPGGIPPPSAPPLHSLTWHAAIFDSRGPWGCTTMGSGDRRGKMSHFVHCSEEAGGVWDTRVKNDSTGFRIRDMQAEPSGRFLSTTHVVDPVNSLPPLADESGEAGGGPSLAERALGGRPVEELPSGQVASTVRVWFRGMRLPKYVPAPPPMGDTDQDPAAASAPLHQRRSFSVAPFKCLMAEAHRNDRAEAISKFQGARSALRGVEVPSRLECFLLTHRAPVVAAKWKDSGVRFDGRFVPSVLVCLCEDFALQCWTETGLNEVLDFEPACLVQLENPFRTLLPSPGQGQGQGQQGHPQEAQAAQQKTEAGGTRPPSPNPQQQQQQGTVAYPFLTSPSDGGFSFTWLTDGEAQLGEAPPLCGEDARLALLSVLLGDEPEVSKYLDAVAKVSSSSSSKDQQGGSGSSKRGGDMVASLPVLAHAHPPELEFGRALMSVPIWRTSRLDVLIVSGQRRKSAFIEHSNWPACSVFAFLGLGGQPRRQPLVRRLHSPEQIPLPCKVAKVVQVELADGLLDWEGGLQGAQRSVQSTTPCLALQTGQEPVLPPCQALVMTSDGDLSVYIFRPRAALETGEAGPAGAAANGVAEFIDVQPLHCASLPGSNRLVPSLASATAASAMKAAAESSLRVTGGGAREVSEALGGLTWGPPTTSHTCRLVAHPSHPWVFCLDQLGRARLCSAPIFPNSLPPTAAEAQNWSLELNGPAGETGGRTKGEAVGHAGEGPSNWGASVRSAMPSLLPLAACEWFPGESVGPPALVSVTAGSRQLVVLQPAAVLVLALRKNPKARAKEKEGGASVEKGKEPTEHEEEAPECLVVKCADSFCSYPDSGPDGVGAKLLEQRKIFFEVGDDLE